MNKALQISCKELISKYDKSDGENKDRIRNEIFCILSFYIYKWLGSSLKKRGVFVSKEEMLSISWDAFEYCMKTYKNREVPLPSHFARNIDYFVIKCLNNKTHKKKKGLVKVDIDAEEYNACIEEDFNFDTEVGIVNISDFLFGFREFIGSEYAKIFDDVVLGKKDKVVAENGKYLPIYRYNEAKKIIKLIILYTLNKSKTD